MVIAITIYLCYRFADGLERLLGPNGTSIVIRLSAFILVCIGIQIMFNGVDEFYTEMVKNATDAPPPSLAVFLLMAVGALHWSAFPAGVLRLVAGNTQPGSCT